MATDSGQSRNINLTPRTHSWLCVCPLPTLRGFQATSLPRDASQMSAHCPTLSALTDQLPGCPAGIGEGANPDSHPLSPMFLLHYCFPPFLGTPFVSHTTPCCSANVPLFPTPFPQHYPYVFTLKEDMATHSSILAWKFPWTEKPGGLQSMGS